MVWPGSFRSPLDEDWWRNSLAFMYTGCGTTTNSYNDNKYNHNYKDNKYKNLAKERETLQEYEDESKEGYATRERPCD